MKKFYTLATSLLLASTAFAAQGDNYWYIRGAFNNYNPNYSDEWALMDDDEGKANEFTGTFTVPAGEFSFNLMNSEGQIFCPMDDDMDATPMNVVFTDNQFFGSASLAWDDDEEGYYWKNTSWNGGMITVTVDASGNNPSIQIDAIPNQEVGDSELYVITPYDDGIIVITWPGYYVWPSKEGAYVLSETGEETPLVRYKSGIETDYQITIQEDYIPGYISIDLNNLNLPDGEYSVIIPEGYVDIVTEDYDFYSNPEISVSFTIGEGTQVDPYWYIRGTFNNFNPAGLMEWALMDDDEGEEGIYTGTFTVDAGSFSFNLMSGQGVIFIPEANYEGTDV